MGQWIEAKTKLAALQQQVQDTQDRQLAGIQNTEAPAVHSATADLDNSFGTCKPSDIRFKAATGGSDAASITVDSTATVTQSMDSLVLTNEPSKGAL
jgi:hypothetical protein